MLSMIWPAFWRSENGMALRPSTGVLAFFVGAFETEFCSGRLTFRGIGESEKSDFRLMLPFRRGCAFGVSSSSLCLSALSADLLQYFYIPNTSPVFAARGVDPTALFLAESLLVCLLW